MFVWNLVHFYVLNSVTVFLGLWDQNFKLWTYCPPIFWSQFLPNVPWCWTRQASKIFEDRSVPSLLNWSIEDGPFLSMTVCWLNVMDDSFPPINPLFFSSFFKPVFIQFWYSHDFFILFYTSLKIRTYWGLDLQIKHSCQFWYKNKFKKRGKREEKKSEGRGKNCWKNEEERTKNTSNSNNKTL